MCCVQIPKALVFGSTTAFACVRRPSLESITSLAGAGDGCGTLAGRFHVPTLTLPLSVRTGAVAVPVIVYMRSALAVEPL